MNVVAWFKKRMGRNQMPDEPVAHNSSNDDPDKEEVRRRQEELRRRLERLRIEAEVRSGRRRIKTSPE